MTGFLAGAVVGALAALVLGTWLWDLPPFPQTESEGDGRDETD